MLIKKSKDKKKSGVNIFSLLSIQYVMLAKKKIEYFFNLEIQSQSFNCFKLIKIYLTMSN